MCLQHLPITFSIIIAIVQGANIPDEYRIFDEIVKNYKAGVIPKQPESAISVNLSMELYQIIEVNEPLQSIRINAWVSERWLDSLLGWDPEEYGNVSQLILPHSTIWRPDTTLYNSLDMSNSDKDRTLHAQLTTCGKSCGAYVRLLYPKIYLSSCLLDLRYFPFDIQLCTFTFGSWSFDNMMIDYTTEENKKSIGVSNCLENDGWNLLHRRNATALRQANRSLFGVTGGIPFRG